MASSFYANSQSLDSLLHKAYSQNPALKALQFEYEAALQKGPQVSQLPDPLVGLGVPILRPETRLGGQVLSISASQMFPWFGTLRAKEDKVVPMAKSKYERIAATRLNIDYQIKTAYYNLYLLNGTQSLIKKNIRIFESLENVALAKVESGKSIASDVLTVRIKVEELNQQIRILEEEKQIHSAMINAAINSPSYERIHVTISDLQLAELAYDLNQLKQKIESGHPLIHQLDWNIEVADKELAINAQTSKPSLGVGLDYSLVKGRTDAMPISNGRDILIPKVMVSIPIYRKKYAAKREEERLKQQAYAMQKEQLTNTMMNQIQGFKSDYESAMLMYNLAEKQIEITTSAYDILLGYYSSYGQRFDELMKQRSDINKYERAMLKAVVQTHISTFKIERLTDY